MTDADKRTVESVAARSPTSVTQALKGVNFPIDKAGLIRKARENHADPEVIKSMEERLPGSGQYKAMADVTHNFGTGGH